MPKDAAGELPPDLRAFLHTCIESIEQVEIVIALREQGAVRTAREVAAQLGISTAAARGHLETLAARGLLDVQVSEETSYRYRPKSPELERYCDMLAHHYATARAAVLGFVATESRLSLKRFADAFKIRGSKS
jgi:predicted ArsR family transcriptional regulator